MSVDQSPLSKAEHPSRDDLRAVLRNVRSAREKAKQKLDSAVAEVRSAIAELNPPWTVRGVAGIAPQQERQVEHVVPPIGAVSTLVGEIVGPTVMSQKASPETACIYPQYVVLERFGGIETRVLVIASADTPMAAIEIAQQQCCAEQQAYDSRVQRIIDEANLAGLREHIRQAAKDEHWASKDWSYHYPNEPLPR